MSTHVSTQVVGEEGLQGRITDQVRADDGIPYVFVAFDSGERARIPKEMLKPRSDGSWYLPLRPADLQQAERAANGDTIVIPVVVEELEVTKRTVETGRVRVRKVVREREEVVDEPLLREELRVERVAVNRPVERPPEVRHEGETLIVPVVEEVLVVEKRLILKEELHITRRQTTIREPQAVTLRSEEVAIERLPPDSGGDADQ